MATIQDYLNKIKTAIYGKDVRQAIHDAIFKCYEDGKAGSIDLVARENINTLTNQVAAMDPENNLQKTGGIMSGDINMNGNKVTGLPDPSADSDAVPLLYMTGAIGDYVHSLGLGTIPQTASDLNTKAETGWWVIGESTANKPDDITLGVVQVIARTSAQVLQIATSTTGIRVRRVTTDYPNSWGEWEYENPNMVHRKEYRTTERFDNKPIYKVYIHKTETTLGNANIGTSTSLHLTSISSLDKIVRADVIVSYVDNDQVKYCPLPIIGGGGSYLHLRDFSRGKNNVNIYANFYYDKLLIDHQVDIYITLYYTKTS